MIISIADEFLGESFFSPARQYFISSGVLSPRQRKIYPTLDHFLITNFARIKG